MVRNKAGASKSVRQAKIADLPVNHRKFADVKGGGITRFTVKMYTEQMKFYLNETDA